MLLLTHTALTHSCFFRFPSHSLPWPILLNPPTSRLLLLSTLSRAIHPYTTIKSSRPGRGRPFPLTPRASSTCCATSISSRALLTSHRQFSISGHLAPLLPSSSPVGHPSIALSRSISKFFADRTLNFFFRQRQPPPRRQNDFGNRTSATSVLTTNLVLQTFFFLPTLHVSPCFHFPGAA